MYWYKGYSAIKVSVHISQTNCEHLKIDVCEIDPHHCIQSGSNYYPKHVKKYSLNEIYNVEDNFYYFNQTNGKECIVFILSTQTLVTWNWNTNM